jgi:hypothetical protein
MVGIERLLRMTQGQMCCTDILVGDRFASPITHGTPEWKRSQVIVDRFPDLSERGVRSAYIIKRKGLSPKLSQAVIKLEGLAMVLETLLIIPEHEM